MRYLTVAGVGLLFVANVALAGAPSCPSGSLYAESGDAGPRTSPQSVSGGSYCGFSGDVGGFLEDESKDQADAFKFFFTGGSFSMFFSPSTGVTRELYSVGDLVTPRPHSGDNWGTLDAGDYIFEVTATSDPPFFAELFTLGPGGDPLPIQAPRATPEPDVLALLLTGLLGLAALRRRAKTA